MHASQRRTVPERPAIRGSGIGQTRPHRTELGGGMFRAGGSMAGFSTLKASWRGLVDAGRSTPRRSTGLSGRTVPRHVPVGRLVGRGSARLRSRRTGPAARAGRAPDARRADSSAGTAPKPRAVTSAWKATRRSRVRSHRSPPPRFGSRLCSAAFITCTSARPKRQRLRVRATEIVRPQLAIRVI